MNSQIKKIKPEEFPKPLHEIPEPPKELHVMGSLPDENLTYLCVVGSRKFTSYGKEVCKSLIAGLKGYPVVIVSGLALGIDSIAHRTALDNSIKTVAFPGSGLKDNVLYPQSNYGLARDIVEKGGCLVSEFEPDFRATEWSFPKRNRLMAGISKAVLVIEAEEKSGTLITARLALDYNRDVLAVPGPITSPNASGTNRLIREGATPITSPEDLIITLGFEAVKKESSLEELSREEKAILELLIEPLAQDELVRTSGLPAQKIAQLISILEIKGFVKNNLGEIHRLI
jgi:DNA processing protein